MSHTLPPERIELVHVLAGVDSLFSAWPDPSESNACCVEMSTRQLQYLDGRGLLWAVGGAAADRKTGERVLGDLAAGGLITSHRAGGSRRQIGLAPLGDDHARSLLEFYRASDSWNVFRALAEAVERGPGRWARAEQVAEGLGETDPRVAWAMLLPLLARGYVESAADTRGRSIFTVRPDMRKLAAGPAPDLLADPAPDPRCNAIYWPSFDAAENEKLGWRPQRDNCCYVPILN